MENHLFRNLPVKKQRIYYHKIGEDMMLDGYSDFKNQDDEEKYYKVVDKRIKKLNEYLEKKKNMLNKLKKNNPQGYKDYIKKEEEEEKKKQNYKKYEDYIEMKEYFE